MPTTPSKLKIELTDQPHKVIRHVLVPNDLNLYQLHLVIQDTVGWLNGHLFEFSDSRFKAKYRVGIPNEDFDELSSIETIDAFKATINDLFVVDNESKPFWYTYDFGDSWEHKVSFLKVTKKDEEIFEGFPICTKAEGACPPEDVGGGWGYSDFLKIINDKSHPEYKETREWAGISPNEKYDGSMVNIGTINVILKDMFDSDEY